MRRPQVGPVSVSAGPDGCVGGYPWLAALHDQLAGGDCAPAGGEPGAASSSCAPQGPAGPRSRSRPAGTCGGGAHRSQAGDHVRQVLEGQWFRLRRWFPQPTTLFTTVILLPSIQAERTSHLPTIRQMKLGRNTRRSFEALGCFRADRPKVTLGAFVRMRSHREI